MHLNGERVNGESSLAPGDRITLGRYGFYAEHAERVGLEVADVYDGEFHRAAKG